MKEYSRRERRREFYELKEKETRRLYERFKLVSKVAWSWGKDSMVELDEPIRRGWVRFFEVRKDVARSKEGLKLNRLLNIVQTPIICEDKSFMRKAHGWTKKNRKIEPIPQELKRLTPKEFEEVPEDLKKYFSKYKDITKFWGSVIEREMYMVNLDWKFSFRIEPHFVTHVKILHSEAISEYTKLRDRLWSTEALAFKYMDGQTDSYRERYKRSDFKEESKKLLKEVELDPMLDL